jgi:hypothetical protein
MWSLAALIIFRLRISTDLGPPPESLITGEVSLFQVIRTVFVVIREMVSCHPGSNPAKARGTGNCCCRVCE